MEMRMHPPYPASVEIPWQSLTVLFSIRLPANIDSMKGPHPTLRFTQLFRMSPRVDALTPTATYPLSLIQLCCTSAYVERNGRVRGPDLMSSNDTPHDPFRKTFHRTVAVALL